METTDSTMERIRCSNCKCWRDPNDFIGKKGKRKLCGFNSLDGIPQGKKYRRLKVSK
jgi:hypothetical protein